MELNMLLDPVELQTQLAEVNESVKVVENQIARVERKLEIAPPEDTHYLREKEKQLRDKEKQLRDKELILLQRQKTRAELPENTLLQLQQTVHAIDQNVHAIDQKLTQQQLPQQVSISKVGSDLARDTMRQLGIPLLRRQDSSADRSELALPQFNMAAYSDETSATPDALAHIQQCLQMHSVTFGPGGFQLLDLHKTKNLFRLLVGNKVFKGGVDGAIVPHLVHPCGAVPQLRCVIELKSPGKLMAQQSSSTVLPSTLAGQALLETLAAAVFAEYPEVMLLLTDMDIAVVMQYEAGQIWITDNLSFARAIGVLAGFLNRCSTEPSYKMDDAEVSDVAAMEPTRRLRQKLRHGDCALFEQLTSVLHPDMSVDEKFFTALEFIQAHRPQEPSAPSNLGDWQFMFG